jgi:hypothetical protein
MPKAVGGTSVSRWAALSCCARVACEMYLAPQKEQVNGSSPVCFLEIYLDLYLYFLFQMYGAIHIHIRYIFLIAFLLEYILRNPFKLLE